MPKPRIMLVDDHVPFRRGLRRVLEQDTGLQVVAEVSCGHEALVQIDQHDPAVVVMDVQLPGLTGLQIATALRRQRPYTNIIFLALRADEDHLFHAIRVGAAAFLTKDAKPPAILEAIHAALRGESLLQDVVLTTPSLARRVLTELHATGDRWRQNGEPGAAFSLRELEVLDCIVMGYSNREIGDEISLAEQTVKNYVTSVLRKLRVDDRVAALRCVVAKGWADIGPRSQGEAVFGLAEAGSLTEQR